MSGKGVAIDKRIAATVAYLKRCPASKVPEAMRACKFTNKESCNPAKQMAVRRAFTKALGGKRKSPPTSSIDQSTVGLSVSPLTEPTTPSGSSGNSETLGGGCNEAMLFPRPKAKQIRLTASGMQQWRINKFDATEHQKRAFKRATSWYAREKEKPDGLSSYAISKKVKVEFDGVGPSPRTLQRYANDGIGGTSPLKPGVQSDIPKSLYKSLCIAFESYIRINQLNARDGNLTLNKLANAVNKCMQHNYRRKLLNRLLISTARDINASKLEYCEDCRIRWTIYKNINMWFDNWEKDLLRLGFAFEDDDGNVMIPDEQLRNIINFDEMCSSVDGSQGRRGGRPEIVLHDPSFR